MWDFVKKCGATLKNGAIAVWEHGLPLLRPISTAGWAAYPLKSFFQWVLQTPPEENVLDNPIAATVVTTGVLVTFSLTIINKYFNLKRKNSNPKKIEKKEIVLGKNPLKWSVYLTFLIFSTLIYPSYCAANGLLSAQGWWEIFSTKPVDDSLLKLILFNFFGAMIAIPAVRSSLTSNRNLIMYDYLPDILDGSVFKNKKAGLALTIASLAIGWPLSFGSNESTVIALNQNLLRHLWSNLCLGDTAASIYSYIFTLAITVNNLAMTPASLNMMLFDSEPLPEDYKKVVSECHTGRIPIRLLCIIDGLDTSSGVAAAMSRKWFTGNPRDWQTAICVGGAAVIAVCIIGTNYQFVLVETRARYAERKTLLPQTNALLSAAEKTSLTPSRAAPSVNDANPSEGTPVITSKNSPKYYSEINRNVVFAAAPTEKDPILPTKTTEAEPPKSRWSSCSIM